MYSDLLGVLYIDIAPKKSLNKVEMANSPKKSPPKTRRTYTRRSPRTKLHDALDELRDLIDRHCGAAPANAPKTAIAQEKAALTTQAPYDAFANIMSPVQNAPLQPTFNATTQFVPQYPNVPFVSTNTYPATTTTAYDPFANFPAQPMMQQPIAQKPKKLASCPGGPQAWNDYVKMRWPQLKEEGYTFEQARTIMKNEYAAKCVLEGTAKKPGTGRKGKPGEPVSKNVAKSLLAAANPFNTPPKAKRTRKAAAQPASNLNNLFGPSTNVKPKTKPTRKAAAQPASNLSNLFSPSTNGKPKTKRTRKVKVQAPGNVAPITPGRNNVNPFYAFTEPEAKTNVKANNFDIFGTSTSGNTNLFGFNQPSIGKINALQQNQPSMKAPSTNSYEYIGEPEENGTRKIRIAGEEYFLTPDDNRLYPDIDGDFGDSVGVFDPSIKGFIREED